MHWQKPESAGPNAGITAADDTKEYKTLLQQKQYGSASLPFGQNIALGDISGPSYLTAQTLVQQVAFSLSDKIFSYSPDTFDLDIAAQQWERANEVNGFGHKTEVAAQQTRAGAGALALGYIFSPDFDVEKRHIPQSILATSGSLQHMRPSLDQLSLLYNVSNPTVAHVAAVDYAPSSSTGLVTDYVTPMTVADDLGYALVSSTSTYEIQHMSLLATVLSKDLPAIHAYDGISVGREATQVVDVQSTTSLYNVYNTISQYMSSAANKHSDNEGKLMNALKSFNTELGTDYKPFEYYGHPEPESVLVVFGSVEGSLAAQLAYVLGNNGSKVAAINVRVYRPFAEDEFIAALPESVSNIAVLGQVSDKAAVGDAAEHSKLFSDVVAAVAFARLDATVNDIKYSREVAWTPSKILALLQNLDKTELSAALADAQPNLDVLGPSVQQYTFWDVDDSAAVYAPTAIAQLLSRNTTENITIRTNYDNLARGGIVRSDVRSSSKSIEAPYPVTSATMTYVRNEEILKDFDVLASLQQEGTVLLRMPDAKGQDQTKFEKRLPESFRKGLIEKKARFYVLDPSASGTFTSSGELQGLLSQLAFLKLAREDVNSKIGKFAAMYGDLESVNKLIAEFENALWQYEIPEGWSSLEVDAKAAARPSGITVNSFAPFEKNKTEPPSYLKTWITPAKGLAFKEATGQRTSLRPDVGVKTHTVHVKEHRRLTPASYDRNVFHIEFDLGNTGLTYAIGEALGIHGENDQQQVEEFIKWYGLVPEEIVEVPSREDPRVLENRTVYQALMQNVDIFGRPPKRFYEQLADFADDEKERKDLLTLGGPEGAGEFKRRAEVDTVTFADILLEYPSAHPSFHDIVRIVNPMKRREYSIASSQKVTPNSVSLLIVTVNWVDSKGRDRFGQATRFLNILPVGAPVTVSVKPSVMKLPQSSKAPLIMAGLGTGLAPFRAFVQERAWQKQQGQEIGAILLYMGSRHQREEYLYGEEWEAYRDAGIITLLGRAFSRDQPEKIYIQDRMRESLEEIQQAYLKEEGAFYLCGPTWPVPDVTEVLEEAIVKDGKEAGSKKVDSRRAIEQLKDELRYVLEVY